MSLGACISPEPSLVVMMCGIAGSGKTTFAKKLEAKGFRRLSIDEEIWKNYGQYGVDYTESEYGLCQDKARQIVESKLVNYLEKDYPVVLDLSFWCRAHRDKARQVIREHNGTCKLVYLKVPREILRERLKIRSQRCDANAAFTITDDILNRYIKGFEVPVDEDPMVIENY